MLGCSDGQKQKKVSLQGSIVNEDELAKNFQQALLDAYNTAKDEYKYNATYFLRMIYEHGGVETAKILINKKESTDGFTKMWELRRLDLTVEANALRPEYQRLFTPEELDKARQRLREYKYPV